MNTYSASHLYQMETNEEMSFLISTLDHIEHCYIHITIPHCPALYQSCMAGDSGCQQYPDSHTKETKYSESTENAMPMASLSSILS